LHVLFIHRSFPGQFRYVAPLLAKRFGWQCTFVTADTRSPSPPEVTKVVYSPTEGASEDGAVAAAAAPVRHALAGYRARKAESDNRPDLGVSHSSYGSTIFLPHLHDAPVVNFFEYFYRASGQDLGYRPDSPVTEANLLHYATRNGMTLLDLENCDRAWCPTEHQRSLMPRPYHDKVEVVHDGIDTGAFRRDPAAPRRLPDGAEVPRGTRVVTYASRGFEKLRGFDVFMRVAKRVYEQFPNVLFVVAGSDQIFYGSERQRAGYRTFRGEQIRGTSHLTNK
jgi:glycosyltransferase involved in cell wall biosynthesis